MKGLVGRCRGIVASRSGVLRKLKDDRNRKDGRWLAKPTWHAVGRADVVQVAATEAGRDWCDVVDELERDGHGVDQSQAKHESHVSQWCAQFCWTSSVSLMWYLSSERHHKKTHCQSVDQQSRERVSGRNCGGRLQNTGRCGLQL